MKVVEPGSPAEGVVTRARNLMFRPAETWDVIDTEDLTIESLYKGWVVPLAAIPAVCGVIGDLGFGGLLPFGIRYHFSLLGVLGGALVTYALTLLSVYVMARVTDSFALRFGGERSRTQAFKLAAYAATPGWLAGIFALVPGIGWLIQLLGALYSLYLLYIGLPKLMRSEPERTTAYFVVILVVTLVLCMVIGALASCVSGWAGPISIV